MLPPPPPAFLLTALALTKPSCVRAAAGQCNSRSGTPPAFAEEIRACGFQPGVTEQEDLRSLAWKLPSGQELVGRAVTRKLCAVRGAVCTTVLQAGVASLHVLRCR